MARTTITRKRAEVHGRSCGAGEAAASTLIAVTSATRNELARATPSALATRSSEAWRQADWQRLWLSLQSQKRSWRSLALVPAGGGVAPGFIQQVAVTLAQTGMAHLGAPIHVADASDIQLEQLVQFSEEVQRYTESAGQILIALPAMSESVTALPLAHAADCALLCVVLDQMGMADAKQTVSRVGADRFIGSAIFRSPRV